MIPEKTVFILGAGASCPYNYPSGAKLKEDICGNETSVIINLIKRHIPSADFTNPLVNEFEKQVLEFVKKFKQSPDSIDLFLYSNPSQSDIGKKLILLYIFHAERVTRFFHNSIDKRDWYTRIFSEMRRGFHDPTSCLELGDNNVVFITFNYDRSLEYFFYNSLINSFEKNKAWATTT